MHERSTASCFVVAALGAALTGQAPGELDFAPAMLPLVDVTSVLSQGSAPVVLTTPLTLVGQNLELHVPLTIAAGGDLQLVRSSLRVYGEVKVLPGGRLSVVDSELTLPNQFQNQFELRVEGGLLHSERATIGSGYLGGLLQQTRLLLLRGTWLARHTVVQGLVTTIGEGRAGWQGNPQWRGGTLVAKGLFEGDRADAMHFASLGDGELVDGTMNVGLYVDVGAATAPSTSVLDLDARHPLTLVYGDPAVHAGVTNPIAASPVRIRLQNHRSPTWMLFATEATGNGPLQTLQLRHAEGILCNLRGTDLTGSPQLAGPWATHYAELPGLPSTERPGHHSLPPGCSVRLGNVRFESGPNDWNHVFAWGLYLKGGNTNLTITGPTNLAELFATDAHVQLAGTGSFDMGVFAETVRLFGTAVVTMTNVRLGDTTRGSGLVGLVEANDQSHCSLQHVRTGAVRLRTTWPQASITTQNVFDAERLVVEQFGGPVTQLQATPTQATDLQNADFEQPLLPGGSPPYWLVQGGSGARIGSPAPGSSGAFCYQFQPVAAAASVGKVLTLPPSTGVSLLGTAQVQSAPASGTARFVATHGALSAAVPLAMASGSWQRALAPLLTTGASLGTVSLQFETANTSNALRLDDLRVVLGSWWDDDNLLNFDFDDDCRARGRAPDYWPEPDGWRGFRLSCETDAADLAPGAAVGSRSLRTTLHAPLGNIYKQLRCLRAGDRLSLTGWVKVPNGTVQVLIGDGFTYYTSTPPNVQSNLLTAGPGWQQITWPGSGTYVVPANPTFTRIDLVCQGPVGSQVWFDQFTVSIQ